MTSKAAVLAWKFSPCTGIVCENDVIVKWEVPAHPDVPTQKEIDAWAIEWEAYQATQIATLT